MGNSVQLLRLVVLRLRLGVVLHSWWRVMKKCLMVMNWLGHCGIRKVTVLGGPQLPKGGRRVDIIM